MKITFQYSRREFKNLLRLNRQLQAPRWLGYGLAILCLLPSMVFVSFLQSQIILVAFAIMMLVVVVLFGIALLNQWPLSDDREHTVTLSNQTFHELHGHSEYEVNWNFLDEFGESDDLFWFRKLDRYLSIPKRVVPSEQHDRVREFGARIEDSQSQQLAHVALFDRITTEAGTEAAVKFLYQQNDVVDAIKEPLVVEGTAPAIKPRQRKRRFFISMWMLGIAAYVLAHLFTLQRQSAPRSTEPWGASEYLFLAAAIVLPFVLLKLIAWLFGNRQHLPRVPDDEKQMWILENGLAMGNPSAFSVYDWRDVECFYQNSFSIGYKVRGGLVHLIPKRIFTEPQTAEKFLADAKTLHREYQRRFAEPVSAAVETGNPYQAP